VNLGLNLVQDPAVELRVFLMGDSVRCADRQDPNAPIAGSAALLAGLTGHGVPVGVCGSCTDAREIPSKQLIKGVHRSSLAEQAEWTIWADKVLSWAHPAG
jgi:uncharacterized protein involved in oxidation of intracellular sulfur